ncbi:MAG TPA: Hint domain-containing protein [Puia sp.]|nr:Hint domain-containing protein [Puia sp.]
MRLKLLLMCLLAAGTGMLRAQDTASVRALTMDEYEKARTFSVGDPDKDTYVKIENKYILDHNGFGKPYFITGDDGKRKRIDLYKLILKEGRVELGTVIFYTTENGKRYTACMPGYKADPKVWRKYFEDIHAIEKEEPFFVLKLSYVLSEELGFQLYRAASGQQGAAVDRAESGTYGNDICFPGEVRVSMADGSSKVLSKVRPGDEVVTVDPVTHLRRAVVVRELTVHDAKNYAITRLTLVSARLRGGFGGRSGRGREVLLSSRVLEVTPNHPMVTAAGEKKAGEVAVGDRVVCGDGTGKYVQYVVWDKTEGAGGMQPVYNIVAGGGSTFVINGVLVMQKPSR